MIHSAERFSRRDWSVAAFFAVAGLGLRVPFRSRFPFHWDSAQFALAINQYDIRLSLPHAPGYFLYVMFGRFVNHIVGDPHASLVWISVISGSVLVGLMYLLGTAMLGGRVGIAAALLTLTSPLIWFQSCIALTYVPDACLVVCFLLISWFAAERGGSWGYAVVLGLLGALIAGVRPQTASTLVPVAALTFWRFRRRRCLHFFASGVVATVFIAAWFVPMLRSSGGWTSFQQIVHLHQQAHAQATVLGGGGSEAFCANVVLATVFCWTGLFLGVVAIVGGLIYREAWMGAELRKQWWRAHKSALYFWASWVIPMVLFGTVLALTRQPGYVLAYIPGLILLAAIALEHLKSRTTFVACILFMTAAHAGIFLSWPWDWQQRLGGFWYTGAEIRQHDVRMASMVGAIQQAYNPADVAICHAQDYLLFGFRHFEYALPSFDQYQLAIDPTVIGLPGRRMWRSHNGQAEFVSGMDLKDKRALLLIVPPGQPPSIFFPYFTNGKLREVVGSHGTIFELDVAHAHG